MIRFYNISQTSMLRDMCSIRNIPFDIDESYDLYEYHLYLHNEQITPEKAFEEIDWEFIKRNNKKLIITHTHIYHLSVFEELLNYYVCKYNCKDNVWWYSFNPYEVSNKKFNIAFLDPITHVNMEIDIVTIKWLKGIDVSYKKINEVEFCDLEKADKYFISTNRKHTASRVLTNHLLNKKNLIKHGYYSFLPYQTKKNYKTIKDSYLQDFNSNNLESYGIDIEEVYLDAFKNHVLDREDLNSPMLTLDSIREFYEKSLVCLVTESLVTNSDMFLTEKTQMALVYGRPFLIIGNKHSLRFLKKYYGFKTFESIFDESYDNCDSFIERTIKVVEELNKFCSLPFSKAKEKIENLTEVLNHNRKVYEGLNSSFLLQKMLTKVMEG